MQIVHRVDAQNRVHRRFYFRDVEMARRGFEQHIDDTSQQPDSAGNHEHADHRGDDRVGGGPASGQDDDRGEHRAERSEQVAEHLEEGGADVQALFGTCVQQRHADERDDQTAACHQEHWQRLDFDARRGEALQSSQDDPAHHDDQRQSVDQRGQDLRSIEAVGLAGGGGSAREANGGYRHAQSEDVAQQVAAIGQECQGAGEPAADNLRQHVDSGDREYSFEATLVALRRTIPWLAHGGFTTQGLRPDPQEVGEQAPGEGGGGADDERGDVGQADDQAESVHDQPVHDQSPGRGTVVLEESIEGRPGVPEDPAVGDDELDEDQHLGSERGGDGQ